MITGATAKQCDGSSVDADRVFLFVYHIGIDEVDRQVALSGVL